MPLANSSEPWKIHPRADTEVTMNYYNIIYD